MKQIPLSEDERLQLGKEYVAAIDEVRSQRTDLVEVWRQAQEDYEAKAPERDWPWPRNISSNAVIPVVPTHVNAIRARLYNTATGQDPIFWPELVGREGLNEDITPEQFQSGVLQLSKYAENEDVNLHDTLNQAILIAVKYGDAIVYAPHVSRERIEYNYDPVADEWTKSDEPVETMGKPVLKVLHPENFYIPVHETGSKAIQQAKFVAYDFELSYDDIVGFREDGTYTPQYAQQLLELLRPPSSETGVKYGPRQDTGDMDTLGNLHNEIKREGFRLAGLEDEVQTGKLKMYHVWAREDTDGDGLEEEIQFHVHARTGIVPHITWNFYQHKKRPFIRVQYEERDGVFYSIGVPEMLANIQKIMNQIMRDILDNNKVQNTKVFLVRKNAGVDPEMRLFPGRMVFLDNPAADFIPQDLGSGRQITSVRDFQVLQQWAERRTFITDFNLGQERTSRTPATTTLALLEESNKTIDYIVRRIRLQLENLWDMVMSLYVQYGFSDEAMREIIGPKADFVQAAIDDMAVSDMRRFFKFKARVTTANLNRSVRRQEALAEFGQIREMNNEVLGLVQAMKQNQDPALHEILMAAYKAYHRIINRFLDTFDEYQTEEINPNLTPQLESLLPGVANAIPTLAETQENPNGELGQALQLDSLQAGGRGPVAPPGRPVSGAERVPNEGLAGGNGV